MNRTRYLQVAVCALCLLIHSSLGRTEEKRLALLPIVNTAKLSKQETAYLEDVVKGSIIDTLKDAYQLVPTQEIVDAQTALKIKKTKGFTDAEAAEVGKTVSADVVIRGEWLVLSGEYRGAFKRINPEDGSMLAMKRAMGDDVATLEKGIPKTIAALLAPLAAEKTAKEVATTEGLFPPPSDEKTYNADISIIASAIKTSDPTQKPFEVAAEVFINNTKVGETPFKDRFPAGDFALEVRYGDAPPYKKRITLAAGQTYTFPVTLLLPLTKPERDAEAAKQRQENNTHLQVAYDDWKKRHDAWATQAAPIQQRRRIFIPVAASSLAVALATSIAGAVLMAQAKQADDNAHYYFDQWQTATDPAERDLYKTELFNTERRRDKRQTAGVVLVSVGGAALIAGVTLFILTPKRPKPPQKPPHLNQLELLGMTLSPLLAAKSAGLSLGRSF